MAKKPKKRDAAYYRDRLRRDHPKVYADLLTGKYPSVRQAAAAVGLIHLPTRVDALKREWNGASPKEQREFLIWLKSVRPAPAKVSIANADGTLRPDAARFLADWVAKNRSKPGRIMRELGFKVFDWRLSSAIYNGTDLPDAVLKPLAPWMVGKGYK